MRTHCLIAAFGILLVTSACRSKKNSDDDSDSDTPHVAPDSIVVSPDSEKAVYAAHEFIPVGESRTLPFHGQFLGTTGDSSILDVGSSASTVTCKASGTACLRFRYRVSQGENEVQTKCFACIDPNISCENAASATLDLEAAAPEKVSSSSNYFASGAGSFYKVCKSGKSLGLKKSTAALPPLYVRTVDAFGEGAYSVDPTELELWLATSLRNFSGKDTARKTQYVLGYEISNPVLHADGSMTGTPPDCTQSPACTTSALPLREGDMVFVATNYRTNSSDNGAGNTLRSIVQGTNPATLDAFVKSHLGYTLSSISDVTDDVKLQIAARLVDAVAMDLALKFFDGTHRLSQGGIKTAIWPHFEVDRYLLCLPEHRARCDELEADLRQALTAKVSKWREAGFNPWYKRGLVIGPENMIAMSEVSWPFEAFDGVVFETHPNGGYTEMLENIDMYTDIMTNLATEMGGTKPVVLFAFNGNLEFPKGGLCEADLCPANLDGHFAFMEKLIKSYMENFPGNLAAGITLTLFDGAHFDIKEPHEDYDGFKLNRAGETLFNNPLINIYLAR